MDRALGHKDSFPRGIRACIFSHNYKMRLNKIVFYRNSTQIFLSLIQNVYSALMIDTKSENLRNAATDFNINARSKFKSNELSKEVAQHMKELAEKESETHVTRYMWENNHRRIRDVNSKLLELQHFYAHRIICSRFFWERVFVAKLTVSGNFGPTSACAAFTKDDAHSTAGSEPLPIPYFSNFC